MCDEAGRYQGCVTPASLHKTGAHSIREAFVNDVNAVPLDTDLHQLATIAQFQRTAKAVEPFDLTWLEIDTWDPTALALIRSKAPCPK